MGICLPLHSEQHSAQDEASSAAAPLGFIPPKKKLRAASSLWHSASGSNKQIDED